VLNRVKQVKKSKHSTTKKGKEYRYRISITVEIFHSYGHHNYVIEKRDQNNITNFFHFGPS